MIRSHNCKLFAPIRSIEQIRAGTVELCFCTIFLDIDVLVCSFFRCLQTQHSKTSVESRPRKSAALVTVKTENNYLIIFAGLHALGLHVFPD